MVVAAISSGTPRETPIAAIAIPESLIAIPTPRATAIATSPGLSIGASRPIREIGFPAESQANSPPRGEVSAVRIGLAST